MTVTETYAGNIVVVKMGDEFQAKASGALNEGRVVELNETVFDMITVAQAGANSTTPLGFVDTDWEANDIATVFTGGIARLEDSGSGITLDTRVCCDSSGKIKTWTSGTHASILGVAMETITASAFGKILVNISHATM